MGSGAELRDHLGGGEYIRASILPLAPARDPVPFRGLLPGLDEPVAFFEDLETALLGRPHAVWSVTGPPGFGRSLFARWAAARWGKMFLEEPERLPFPLLLGPKELADLHRYSRRGVVRQNHLVLAVLESSPFRGLAPAERERLDAVLREHPLVAIVDRDEGSRFPLGLRPAASGPDHRTLVFSQEAPLQGPHARLASWDRDSRLLAAHRARGEEGIRRLEAVEASPAAGLAGYPLFLSHLLDCPEAPPEELRKDGGAGEFLRWVHGPPGGSARKFWNWCEELACEQYETPALARQARLLHSRIAPGHDPELHILFLASILSELIRARRTRAAFRLRVYTETEVDLLGRVLEATGKTQELQAEKTCHAIEASNRVNLHWRLHRNPVPERLLLEAREVRIAGYRFGGKVRGLDLQGSDLSGIGAKGSQFRACRFRDCSFRCADLAGTRIEVCELIGGEFRGASFSECSFKDSSLEGVDLSEAVLSGARFDGCTLEGVTFGESARKHALSFKRCTLRRSDVRGLAQVGLFLANCLAQELDLSGLEPRSLHAEKTSVEQCDLSGVAAHGANLKGVQLSGCLLHDVHLPGADLRHARLEDVDFQPGPGSRAGHTPGSTRGHPLYGSQTGFYADDALAGTWGDPEMVRLADLTGADLRGAVIVRTDLFRVDLRGARLDPALRGSARRMGAFLDDEEVGQA